MKTVEQFYKKYGTGINYSDFLAIMKSSKHTSLQSLKETYEMFVKDLQEVLKNEFDFFLWQDYKMLTK